jgi:Tfp pilus assembly protein PilO
MLRLGEKQLLIVTVSVSILIALGLGALNIFVFNKNLGKVKQAISEKDSEIDQAKEKKKQMDQLRRDVEQLERDKKIFEEKLPTMSEVIYENFIDTLNIITKDAGILLKNAKLAPKDKKAGTGSTSFQVISYDLQTEGDFFDLIRFISILEEYPRFIKVNYFTLSIQDLSQAMITGKTKHSMNIRITTYVYTGK